MSDLLRLIEAYGDARVTDHADGYHRPGKADDEVKRCRWELVEYVDCMTTWVIDGRSPTPTDRPARGEDE